MILPVSFNNPKSRYKPSFEKNTLRLSKNSRETLESIIYAYREITSKMNPSAVNDLKKNITYLDISDGLRLNNSDSTLSVSLGKTSTNQVIICRKTQGAEPQTYIIKNFETLESNDNSLTDDLFQNLLEKFDTSICRLRQFISQFDAGKLANSTKEKLDKIPEVTDEINRILKTKTRFASDKLKNGFGNYCKLSGQSALVFKDGDLKINCAELNNKQHGKFMRIIVWDNNNYIKDACLIKDGKAVKNYNPKFYSVVPDNLIFYNKKEIPAKEELINHYLGSYTKNLFEFAEHITSKQNIGRLNSNIFSQLIKIKKLYEETSKMLSQVPARKLPEAKGAFSFFDKNSCRGRFRFLNVTTDGDNISYFPVPERISPDTFRLEITDKNNNIVKALLVHKNEFVVKNYTPKFQSQIPENKEYMTEEELEKASEVLETYLPILNKNMILFKTFVEMYCKKMSY